VAGQHNNEQPLGMIAGAALIFFAYIGFDAVSTQAEEAKNPQRDVPIGIIASLIICTILYIAVVVVLTGMVKYDQLDTKAAVSEAFAHPSVGMGWAKGMIAAAALAGLTSVLLVMLLGSARILMAMSRDGLLPPFFSDIHPSFRTPWKGTLVVGFFVALMAGLLPLDALLEMTNIGTLFAFAVVCASVQVLRMTNPTAPRPFRCPLVPVVPVLGVLTCLLLMLSLPAANWARLIGWLAVGLVIYFAYGRSHSLLNRRAA
jgi:APA family basic amino acid/polyamine antiporter